MKAVILDTNFLLIPGQFRIDIFSEIERLCDFPYRLKMIDKTMDELRHIISAQKGRHKASASLALQLVKAKDIDVIPGLPDESVDSSIISISDKKNYVVCTLDKELRRQLKEKGIPMIVMRQKKYLMMYNLH
ncbi:nucleotide-binding protein [Candidatus Woesearchaeota archaeon]|nr:nucleotide-binding protein [Candidatus Woesearchaeota archaeon]